MFLARLPVSTLYRKVARWSHTESGWQKDVPRKCLDLHCGAVLSGAAQRALSGQRRLARTNASRLKQGGKGAVQLRPLKVSGPHYLSDAACEGASTNHQKYVRFVTDQGNARSQCDAGCIGVETEHVRDRQ